MIVLSVAKLQIRLYTHALVNLVVTGMVPVWYDTEMIIISDMVAQSLIHLFLYRCSILSDYRLILLMSTDIYFVHLVQCVTVAHWG